VVRAMTIDFLRPARMDDILNVVTAPEEIKGASVVLGQQVMRGEELLVAAHVRVAFVVGGRARPIPKPLRIAMTGDRDLVHAAVALDPLTSALLTLPQIHEMTDRMLEAEARWLPQFSDGARVRR